MNKFNSSTIEKIDYDYILSIIEEVQNKYENSTYKEPSYFNSLWFKMYKNYLPEIIKEKIIRPVFWGYNLKKEKEKYYFPSNDDKKWNIDFLNYIFKFKPEFDLSYFDDNYILNFIKNIL